MSSSDPRVVDVDGAMEVALADLEEDLTEVLGQKPDLISVRFERAKGADHVRIEVWAHALPTVGKNLSTSARTLDSCAKDMLEWARKIMAGKPGASGRQR